MANNFDFDHKRDKRFGPLFVIANLAFAIGIAFFISMADNLSVRGGGFSVYAGPISNAQPDSDGNGNDSRGNSYILVTSTPEKSDPDNDSDSAVDNEPTQSDAATNNSEPNQDGEADPQTGETATVLNPTPINEICLKPAGWHFHIVQWGETLGYIAQQTGSTIESLKKANCLTTDQINRGTAFYVPVQLASAHTGSNGGSGSTQAPVDPGDVTPIPPNCNNHPGNWLPYYVRPGDNVFRMALNSSVTVTDIVVANCLLSASHVVAGQIIYLPPDASQVADGGFPLESEQPEPTPVVAQPTATPAPPTNTPEPVETATEPVTATAEATMTPTAQETQAVANTPEPSPTNTFVPTSTSIPLFTPTPVPTNTAVPIFTPTPVPTETTEPTSTQTLIPTATEDGSAPMPMPSATPSIAPTVEPTETLPATNTPVSTATETLVPTATETLVPTPTETLAPPPTATNTVEPTAVPPTATNTIEPTATVPPSPTATETLIPTPTETLVPPPTATNTVEPPPDSDSE